MTHYMQSEFGFDLPQGDSLPTWMRGLDYNPPAKTERLALQLPLFDITLYASPKEDTSRSDRREQAAILAS